MLEVFNDVGTVLLKEALDPAAVGTASVDPQDQLPKLKDDETGIIPAIRVDRMGYATNPRAPRNDGGMMVGLPGHRRNPGNETSALHD